MAPAAEQSPLESFFARKVLPSLGSSLGALQAVQSQKRKDLIDIDIISKSKKATRHLAEVRIDLLHAPAILHLFIHHYSLEKALKRSLGENLHHIERLLRKSITIDSTYSDSLHNFTASMHKVGEELDNLRGAISALTKVRHTSGFPKYGYSSLPSVLKGFGEHLPSSVTLDIYRGRILPKAAVRVHFRGFHGKDEQSCIVSLAPELYKEVMGALKYPLSRLQDRVEDVFKKAVHMEYHPMAKA